MLAEIAALLDETLDPSIRVTVRCSPSLPPILGDDVQIHQVLLNMSLNARDAMPHGGRLLLEASAAGTPARPAVQVRVRDTGTGMDAATLAKVFDPFFTTKAGGAGTGLGLYMAYRVVERHGGSIDVSSQPGSGTTIDITLPSGAVGEGADGGDIAGAVDRTRPGGRRFGALVHAALTVAPLGGSAAALGAVVAVQARLLGAPEEERAAATAALVQALAHPLFDRARAAEARGALRRESPVFLRLEDGTLAEGVVDLAFREDGRWTVVEIKTDAELADTLLRSEAQVALYVRAVAAATGEPAEGILLAI
jgi:hypothetical protein